MILYKLNLQYFYKNQNKKFIFKNNALKQPYFYKTLKNYFLLSTLKIILKNKHHMVKRARAQDTSENFYIFKLF